MESEDILNSQLCYLIIQNKLYFITYKCILNDITQLDMMWYARSEQYLNGSDHPPLTDFLFVHKLSSFNA
jgi:hypothetical protein